jgi:hypothetical protein
MKPTFAKSPYIPSQRTLACVQGRTPPAEGGVPS